MRQLSRDEWKALDEARAVFDRQAEAAEERLDTIAVRLDMAGFLREGRQRDLRIAELLGQADGIVDGIQLRKAQARKIAALQAALIKRGLAPFGATA